MVVMAKRQERQRQPKRTDLAEFGRVLDSLMRLKGVRTQTKLSQMLKDDGYPVSQPMIGNYMFSDPPAPSRFVVEVMRVLKLDNRQQQELAAAWRDSMPADERRLLEIVWGIGKGNITAEDLEDLDAYEAGDDAAEGEAPGGDAENR